MSSDFPRALSLALSLYLSLPFSYIHTFLLLFFLTLSLFISPSPNPNWISCSASLSTPLLFFFFYLSSLHTHSQDCSSGRQRASVNLCVSVSVCECKWVCVCACVYVCVACAESVCMCETPSVMWEPEREILDFSWNLNPSPKLLWADLYSNTFICCESATPSVSLGSQTHTHFLQRVRVFVCVRHNFGRTSSNTARVLAPRASPEWCAKYTEMSQRNGRLQLSFCSHAPLRVSVPVFLFSACNQIWEPCWCRQADVRALSE